MILASSIDLKPLLRSAGQISARDVLEFRREIFRDGLASKHEADAIFMINDAVPEQCSQWREFFVETLGDFAVDGLEPRGCLSVENGEWLVRQISCNGCIKGASELELLVKAIETAAACPQKLVDYLLEIVEELGVCQDAA